MDTHLLYAYPNSFASGPLNPPSHPILHHFASNIIADISPSYGQTADYSADEADEETHSYLQKEIEEAEKNGYDQGKPGGFLNKLIAHGNRKTEEQLARETRRQQQSYESRDEVIR